MFSKAEPKPQKQGKTVVALYCRVSTLDQANNNYSMGVQAERLKKYCLDNGFRYRIYRDSGESGGDVDRPKFQTMLRDAEMGKFNLLLVDKIDRLCRNLQDLVELYSYLDSLGISIKSFSEPIDSSVPMGKYFLYQLGMFAEMERDWFRERSKKGREARLREGKWHGGQPPYGYDYDKESGKLTVNETEKKIVMEIFNKYLKYKSLKQVANYLNDQGIQTRVGSVWRAATILGILKRTAYIGKIEQAGIGSDVEAIVEEGVFERAQRVLEGRKKYSPKRWEIKKTYVDRKFCQNCGMVAFKNMQYCSGCGVELIGYP
ncbi:MAG: recombinase family protein [Candidatus Nanoarchaeia archaeon]|nr:recombinase family protein [Candidatus Nanoarchaeia archaeon]